MDDRTVRRNEVDELLRRVCSEYLEMPGLRLTLPQAQRLWGLDAPTCAQVLRSLTEQHFLSCRPNGTYVRDTDDTTYKFPRPRAAKFTDVLLPSGSRAVGRRG